MSALGRLDALAAVQHSIVHLRQLDEAGLSRHATAWAVEAGELIREAPEVFRTAGAPRTWRSRLMVAVLDAGPGAAVSHRSAALLEGLGRRDAPEVVEISVPRSASARLAHVHVHRPLDLRPDHVLITDGIPCTGPLRTLVDLGAVENRFEVRDAVERGLSSRLVTLKGLEWTVNEHSRRGRAGVGVLRWVLDERALGQTMPDSVLEARMARIERRYNLPTLSFQHDVFDDEGTFIARVDFAEPRLRHAFEVDGWEHHSTPLQVEADYDREHRLRAAGWSLTRFTYWHVVKRPAYVARVIEDVLGALRTVVPA